MSPCQGRWPGPRRVWAPRPLAPRMDAPCTALPGARGASRPVASHLVPPHGLPTVASRPVASMLVHVPSVHFRPLS